MPRITYRFYEELDARSRGYIDYAGDRGTPRPESQAIRAHVPDVDLGFFIGLTLGPQRWIKTLNIGHLEYLPDTTAGLLPGFSVAGT